MMKVKEILSLIDSLTSYIAYFYPGYITIYVFLFLKAQTMKDNKAIVIKSIIISFMYNVCLKNVISDTEILYHLALFSIALIVPYICYFARFWKIVKKVFDILKIRVRFEDNAIDVLDTDEVSPWIRVYMKDNSVVYAGFLGEKELEEGTKQFITLKKYRKYTLDEEKRPKHPYIEENGTDDDMVLIFYDEIKIIEKVNIKCNNDGEEA